MGLFGPSLKELANKEYELRKKYKEKNGYVKPIIEKQTLSKNPRNIFLYTFFITIVLSILVIFLWFNPFNMNKGITLSEFNNIQNGMTYQEVVNIIGENGTLLGNADLNLGKEYEASIYMWYGNNGIANANITFQGGKVIAKAQFGLF